MTPDTKAITTIVCNLAQNIPIFVVVKLTPWMESNLGMPFLFWTFSVMCAANFAFSYKFIPETHGLPYGISSAFKNGIGEASNDESEINENKLTA